MKTAKSKLLANTTFWVLQELFLLAFGGIVYYNIEILWRGYSHPSMALLGGLCFISIGLINEIFPYSMKFEYQIIVGVLLVTILEFIFGYILNIQMGLNIWDYSNMPLNVMGQICVPYMFLWIFLVALSIVVDDWSKYFLSSFIYKRFMIIKFYLRPRYSFLIKNII